MATKTKRPVGRPLIELDPEKAAIFGYFRATFETMAAQCGCSVDTIRRFMRDEDSGFSKAYKKGLSGMKMKLSEAQINSAIEDRNPTMLVWLGKQYLGQTDQPALDSEATRPPRIIYSIAGDTQGDE